MVVRACFIIFVLFLGVINATTLKNLHMGSMPCFQNETNLIIDNHPFSTLAVGDIICYRPSNAQLQSIRKYTDLSPIAQRMSAFFEGNNNNLCHRIVYIGNEFVITKGDSNIYSDPFEISADSYVGFLNDPKCY